jgi:hypothetical protein
MTMGELAANAASAGDSHRRQSALCVAAVLLLVACWQTLRVGAAEKPLPAGTIPAALSIKIELSSSGVEFLQTGRPGFLTPEQTVQMQVVCFSRSWTVAAKATPLAKRSGAAQIEPGRLFVRSNGTQPHPDVGAGPGFVPLDSPVLVAEGSVPVYSTPLEFRLLTFWEDTPGIYEGDIQFTAVAVP